MCLRCFPAWNTARTEIWTGTRRSWSTSGLTRVAERRARRYVKSRSDTQLRGEQPGGGLLDSLGVGGSNNMKNCDPQRTRTLPNGTMLVRYDSQLLRRCTGARSFIRLTHL